MAFLRPHLKTARPRTSVLDGPGDKTGKVTHVGAGCRESGDGRRPCTATASSGGPAPGTGSFSGRARRSTDSLEPDRRDVSEGASELLPHARGSSRYRRIGFGSRPAMRPGREVRSPPVVSVGA